MRHQGELCRAELYIGDDYEDGVATMQCMLPAGREGQHEERFEREVGERKGWVTVRWDLDERGYKYGVLYEDKP
jgi:hypothetical protein